MKIAVTSQNFRTVTGHAGRARRFLVYTPGPDGKLAEAQRIDLPKEQSLHAFHGAHPVEVADVMITGSCGAGLVNRLALRGVRVVVTGESDPLAAAQAVLEGRPLAPPLPEAHDHGSHADCGCGH
jgi:predicted Fe-Mo cluster-binding NifX family protein